MKQIKHIFVLVTIGLTILNCVAVKGTTPNANDISDSLLQQVIKETQNPEHKEEKLLSLLLTLLKHGQVTEQTSMYAQSIFKLFSNVTKGMRYVNAYTLTVFLEKLNNHIPYYFTNKTGQLYLKNKPIDIYTTFDRFKSTVNNILYVRFSTEYDKFKNSPEEFLNNVSQDIVNVATEEITIDKLRNSMLRFLELTLSKTLWAIDEPEESWKSVKYIANNITILFENNVLNDINDLDDLFWSLIHRYAFFLDVTSGDLPISFYEHIRNDILSSNLLFLKLEEQDSFLETKGSFLHRSIIQAEVKARAFDKGIVI